MRTRQWLLIGTLLTLPLCGLLLSWCGSETLPIVKTDSSDQHTDSNPDAFLTPEVDVSDSATACVSPPIAQHCQDGWCEIPAGCFPLGSPVTEWGRAPIGEDIILTTLTHPFIIQQYELTQEQWTSLGFPNRSGVEDAGPTSVADCLTRECPASRMSWFDAAKFANDLSLKEGRKPCYVFKNCTTTDAGTFYCDEGQPSAATPYDCEGYRMPTEAEWEYAARAGTKTAFYSGEITPNPNGTSECSDDTNLDSIAWYCWNSGATTHPVGMKKPNAFGLYDMSGNASEFANDPDKFRTQRGSVDPWTPITNAVAPVSRGGAVYEFTGQHRSAWRNSSGPFRFGAYCMGFRLARTIAPNEQWIAPPLPIPYKDGGLPQKADGGVKDASSD